jgi:hypothetical protein
VNADQAAAGRRRGGNSSSSAELLGYVAALLPQWKLNLLAQGSSPEKQGQAQCPISLVAAFRQKVSVRQGRAQGAQSRRSQNEVADAIGAQDDDLARRLWQAREKTGPPVSPGLMLRVRSTGALPAAMRASVDGIVHLKS